MPDISNGSLNFKSSLDNEQLLSAIDETLRRVRGMSDGTASAGRAMDASMTEMMNAVKAALGKAGEQCEMHERQIASLRDEYMRLLKEYNAADSAGQSDVANKIQRRMNAIQKEIDLRKKLLKETRDASNELETESEKLSKVSNAAEQVNEKHTSMRQQMRELREQMADLLANGVTKEDEAYIKLRDRLGELTDMYGDVQTAGKVMANDEAQIAGVINGLSGLSGAFQAVTGTVSLFAGENENLQKVMTKLQSLMSITMGLQQLQQTLNEDSAFMITTLGGLKQWWNKITSQSIVEQKAENAATVAGTTAKGANAAAETVNTAATTANTAATGTNTGATAGNTAATGVNTAATVANTAAAGAGTVANWSLAASFRAIAAAIKSIPVFGWIAAGIGALITAVSLFGDDENDATDAVKKNTDAVKENQKAMSVADTITDEVSKTASEEIGKVTLLTGVIHDNTISVDQRRKAVDALRRIIPAYNAQISEEGRITRENTDAVNRYIDALERRAKAQAVQKVMTEITEKELRSQLKISHLQNQKNEQDKKNANWKWSKEGQEAQKVFRDRPASEMERSSYATGLRLGRGRSNQLQKQINDEKKEAQDINRQKQELLNYIKENDLYGSVFDQTSGSASGHTGGGGGHTGGGGGGGTVKETPLEKFQKFLDKMKGMYDDYAKWVNSDDEIVRNAAKDEFAGLVDQGNSYIEFLRQQRDILMAIPADKITKDQTDRLHELNDRIADNAKTTVLESFNDDLNKQLNAANGILEQLKVIEDKRKELSGDGSELDEAKKKSLDDAEQKANDKSAQDYKSMLNEYMSYEEQREAIRKQFADKRALAEKNGNTEILDALNRAEQKALSDVNFDELKNSSDYIRAFEDLDFASSETLQHLIERFESVKESAGANLNPDDVKGYVDAIATMVDELNQRDPFGQLVKGYKELKAAGNELKAAERELQAIRDNGGKGTDKETQAIKKVNAAKDKYNKKNKEVRKSEKEVESQVGKVCDSLKEVGEAIGGEAGQIISLIGDIGNFVLQTVDSVKAVAKTGADAISTIEKASVILAVISAAYQIASKIFSMFAGDDGTAEYEKASKIYDAYVDAINDVIDAEKELMTTLTGSERTQAFEYSLQLINKQIDAARELGKQYLNAGASSGFLGIGSKASHGVDMRKNISGEAWNELRRQYTEIGLTYKQLQEIMSGRMTALFDMTAEQIEKMKKLAPLFFANLDEDVQKYLNDIINAQQAIKDTTADFNESLTGISFDDMRDDFLSALQDMELDAKTISDNIQDYLRKALITNMFKKQYAKQLEDYYNAFADAFKEDSDGGETVTDAERSALDRMRDAIVSGATNATEEINKQFADLLNTTEEDETLTGAVKGITEETANILAGQMNAIRINQVESAAVLRNQLMSLNRIVENTSHLAKIDRVITLLEGNDNNAELRSQGLI